MTEISKSTEEVPVDPVKTLRDFKQNPLFENRLMTNFLEQKAVKGQIKAVQKGDKITIFTPVEGSTLSLRLAGTANDTRNWRLSIQNLQRNPDPEWSLADIYRRNIIEWESKKGSLEFVNFKGLSDPNTAEVMRMLADLSDMDRQTRNIRSILEGYKKITDPFIQLYLSLINDFSDPAMLRVQERHLIKRPPSPAIIAGIVEDPRMHVTSNIYLDLYGNDWLSDVKSVSCWVNWSGDKGEDFIYPRQTVFGFNLREGFFYNEGTFNLQPGTVRKEISDRMLVSLNEAALSRLSLFRQLGLKLFGLS